MRRFVLNRAKDVSGVSGTGVIADGVQFSDGQCVLHWRGRWHSTEILTSITEVTDIHGHDGATVVEWVDWPDGQPQKPRDFGEQ